MPASEETYRSQPVLHIVFAVSSIAMTLAIVWMIMADHLRPWKEVQREFQRVERAKLEASEQEALTKQKETAQAKIESIDAEIKQAEANAGSRRAELRKVEGELAGLKANAEGLDTSRKFKKAELDSLRSFYDGMIERGEEGRARRYLNTTIADAEKQLGDLSRQLEQAQSDLKKKQAQKEELLGFVDRLTKDKEKYTRDYDRARRVLEQKEAQYFGIMAWLRGLPGIDMAASPTKIQQISLPDLTINYNFKEVPRYDRCTTCHQGIDRIGYDKDAAGQPMPEVFAAHPFLTNGALATDTKGRTVTAGLYLDPNGPHPINSFGCTICHGGQGSGTDFTFASHTPADPEEEEHWRAKYGWQEIHHWDYPMLPARFTESSCLKCHHQVTDIPQAKKLQAGYERIVRYGCTGCHTIGGEGSFGPDLTDERTVGPNLAHIGAKVSPEFVARWIKDPHAFRPDSRMPRFYGVSNNDAPEDQPKTDAEIQAITHYLFARSTPPENFDAPPAKTDPARGKELFLQKGCMACHQHRPYDPASVQPADREHLNPNYKPDPSATYDPAGFPEAVREYAKADYGPNLGNVAAKFRSEPDKGLKWLSNWIQNPEKYHPKSLMPNLQLAFQDAADIAAWLISVPGDWPVEVKVAPVSDGKVGPALDELVKLYVSKGGFKGREKDAKLVAVPLSEVDQFVARLSTEDKLDFVGEKTINRLGCFGCHSIPGFENAKPIGTPLNDWGIKSPTRLDYGHILEYLEDKPAAAGGDRDGTDKFYQEQLGHETRIGFLYQKLHRPRSYDFLKNKDRYKTWDDRLRMPQFAWANDPAAVEEVMTFILGLTGEKIASRYLAKTRYNEVKTALAKGSKVLNRYNCAGCHVLEMPKFIVPEGTKVADAFTDFKTNVRSSYNARAGDYIPQIYADLQFDPAKKLDAQNVEQELGLKPDEGTAPVTIEGMPIGLFEDELTVQLWKPVTIRGYTFNIGDNVTLDRTKIRQVPAVGGDFAWLFSTVAQEKAGTSFEAFWNRLPPPLLREGNKVQTPWLALFLLDPYAIRPAAQLRMPRFHYGKAMGTRSRETEEIADYFAARDGAEFPYQTIPQHQAGYIAERNGAHPNYLGAGWSMMANKSSPCIQCHAVGPYKPTGGEQVVNGPDLRQVASRFRPGFLETWIANPKRLVPYTAMPQNVAPRGDVQLPVPKTFEKQPLEMVRAIRDTLLNYANVVEQQLAAGANPQPPAAAQPGAQPSPTASAPPARPTGGGQ
ncbi:Cytochrome c [Aquisphaera giovannonii]|uniref:Cytochrome c n=1 Tax=Aquisphaera giovannonii TaxID=406548 RepID=A0A5B9W8D4_9BACT|nr:c-type cytochrome [Aquisphaera giovannonii]QEH36868.1 Cytochrome c [Aquisphaera giovannonii]